MSSAKTVNHRRSYGWSPQLNSVVELKIRVAIHAGLKETRTGLRQAGSAFAFSGYVSSTRAVHKIVFVVQNSLAGEPVDMTSPYTGDDSGTDPNIVNGSTAATIILHADENQRLSDVPWSTVFIGTNNSNFLLEDGEKSEVTDWLMDRITAVATSANSSIAYMDGTIANGGGGSGLSSSDALSVGSTLFILEMPPITGALLTIQGSVPPGLRAVMNLD